MSSTRTRGLADEIRVEVGRGVVNVRCFVETEHDLVHDIDCLRMMPMSPI